MENGIFITHNKDIYMNNILFHSHDFYEFYFFVNGNVSYYVENESYEMKRGDILIIPPGKLHRPVIDNNLPYERYVLWIYRSYLTKDNGVHDFLTEINRLVKEKNTRLISFDGTTMEYLCKLLDATIMYYKSEEPISAFTTQSCITLILDMIRNNFLNAHYVDSSSDNIIRQVITYINDNFIRSPSLDELSERFFVSKFYLSHKFKEYTRTTIHNYILMKKINYAKELLNMDIPLHQVSEECGFTTYSNFYKTFVSQTGVSPRMYQKN